MKATRQEEPKKFVPVTLTLETQAEVDAVYALLNFTVLARAAGVNGDAPHDFRSLDYVDIRDSIAEAAKQFGRNFG